MTPRRLILFAALGLLVSAASVRAQSASPPPPPPYRVIVHPKNPTTAISRKLLGELFLKKSTRWGHDVVVRPVDQLVSAPVRRRFSEAVLKRSVAAVKSYWQQAIFSGRDVPPPELDSDQAVIEFVLKHEGAVGYVSGTADTGAAKIITVR
jgi:hypothetical protein